MRERTSNKRCGMALFWTLGLLTVLMAVVAILTQTFISAQRASRHREQRLQADLLAESALARAAARLADNTDYQGEQWTLDSQTHGLAYPADIKITLKPVAQQPSLRHTEILVTYGIDREQSVVVEKQSQLSSRGVPNVKPGVQP